MARLNPVFVCSACGGETLKWQGQCPLCSEWNSLEQRSAARARPAAAAAPAAAVALGSQSQAMGGSGRLTSGAGELDRVLGGGFVTGSVILLGGEPGIGKSTLLLQVAAHLAQGTPGDLCQRRGVRGAGEPACRAPGPERRGPEPGVRDRSAGDPGARQRAAGGAAGGGFHPDGAVRQRRHPRRRRLAAARVHRGTGALRQVHRLHRGDRRPRDQGGHDRRAAAARAPGGHGAVFPERGGQPLPHRARHQEPLRGGERARLLRHDRDRTEGSEEPGGDLPRPRPRGRPGQHRHRDARGRPAAADRAAGAGGPDALWCTAARGTGPGRQSPGDAARGRQPARAGLAAGARRVRQRGRRHRDLRDRLGPAGAAGAGIEPGGPRHPGARGRLRRDRPHRRGASGGLRR